jgi:chromosome segregation protein
MRLTSVKLSGFKSFVDSTTFLAPTNLTGVVGPNGCGKSNIIDAVRWVMGEGSARVLRGELMSDVIFSGSSTRKPVGTATVELVFVNSLNKIGGEYAAYDEISVKRQVGRDGISLYELNGSRCRRKDIKDLFLGTGLGSKSYSIIEQGMISQVVDARPEEIREHLEEAAGISKYKERRRETERRIKHTRENLDRLSDLREEVSKQLDRLKRQARAAERYRKLKQEQRDLQSRLLALQWRDQQNLAEQGKAGLQIQETALQESLAEQRASEARLEELHQQQASASESFNTIQGELYAVASDIARLEQDMQHSREMQLQQQKEFDDVSAALKDIEQHMMLDKTQVEHLTTSIAEVEPLLNAAQNTESSNDQQLIDAESLVQAWQEKFEVHHRSSAQMSREADGLRARVEILDQSMSAATDRLEKLAGETKSVASEPLSDDIEKLKKLIGKAVDQENSQQAAYEKAKDQMLASRSELVQSRESENEMLLQLNAVKGRLEALRAIQSASSESKQGKEWLSKHGLADAPQLAATIQTQKGWEDAVETVLGSWLSSLLVRDPGSSAPHISELKNAELSIIQDSHGKVRARSGTLAEKVTAPDAVIAMLNHVRIEKDLASASEYLDVAGDEQSAITKAGEWVGPGWIRISRSETGQAGILARGKEIKQLEQQLGSLESDLKKLKTVIDHSREAISSQEESLEAAQTSLNQIHRQRSDLESQLGGKKSRMSDLQSREIQIGEEQARLKAQLKNNKAEIKTTRQALEKVLDQMAGEESTRKALDAQRKSLLEGRENARSVALKARDARHELALKAGSQRASLDSLQQSLERMDNQVSLLQQRYIALSELIAKARNPEKEFKAEMDRLLQTRVEVEARLGAARDVLNKLEDEYRQQDASRQQSMLKMDEVRSFLEQARLQQQEVELTARNLQRRVEELGEDVETIAESLPESADFESWSADIERLGIRITRLEPVNLAAISEYEEESKRKDYMDAQNEDLTKALETLEGAIAKIDRKTRTRFKDTFEEVNKGVQELFPRLFGGGHAYLELTGDDLLTTGVSIMARPPGKRVSSIHLLSGGEKALTAVSFVFAIFHLNPAPFCMLDEVDAPLDDANVGRFSALVKEMSETVQFIVVTHNKITMEMVHQLSGVTMREPGVSRLVQVDIEEAARLAAT